MLIGERHVKHLYITSTSFWKKNSATKTCVFNE